MKTSLIMSLILSLGLTANAKTEAAAKRALIVVTNHNVKGSTGQQTGWFLSEVTHVYYPLLKAGYKIDFASPQGGKAPVDESSVDLKDADNKAFYTDKKLMAAMDKTLNINNVKASDYKIVHFAGGHGAVWDFPESKGIQKIAAAIYENGGIVAAVCHGPAALVNVKLSNGEYLVKGKDVSAFTDKEEEQVGLTKVVPFLLESTLRERGAIMHPADNWKDQSIISDRLVTGQNPQSAHSVAQKILQVAEGK